LNLLTEHLATWIAADTAEKSARGRSAAASLYGVKKLRELILELAVRGLLVPQNADDEPATVLLKKIAAEKAQLVKEGKIKAQKPLPPIGDDEKPFELPKGWEWARLGDIGYTQTGGTPSKNNPEYFGQDIPFIKPSDIYPSLVDYDNEGLTITGKDALGRTAISGSILMVCIGTIGKCNSITKECAFNQQINSISPYINITSFLLLALRSNYFQSTAWSRSASTTIAILNKGKWEAILIPLPPLAEQQRIVAKVDELMALCDQLEQQQNNSQTAHQHLVGQLLNALTQAANANDFQHTWQRIASHFDVLFTTEDSINQLKQSILQLAVMGKLVPQNPEDEPASQLLKKIAAEKAQLVKEGKIKAQKPLPPIGDDEKPFELPHGWEWVRLGDIIPLPPLAEQQRIVTKVDELMALCDQLKNQLNQAKHLQGKIADVLVEQALSNNV
jgi:type I restriction enzyme S subunit